MTDEEVDDWLRRENDKLVESLKVCPSCGLMIGHSDVCPVCND
jgi:ribosomal protein S27AE